MPALLSGSANILILTVDKYNEDTMFADGMISFQEPLASDSHALYKGVY
jgi:hypothetical protein